MRRGPGAASESDALQAYLRAIAKLLRVTATEERELGRRIQRDG
ncbi:MAG: sigma-70 factor domain-containing protein, partial [Vicinamibacterales bacterium]